MTSERPWSDIPITPTPHQAYVENVTPKTAEAIVDAVSARAVLDYIAALSHLEDHPRDGIARRTVQECEDYFTLFNKLETVKHKVKFGGGMFKVICMETFPSVWGEEQPKDKTEWQPCPVCKEGRIKITFQPKALTEDLEQLTYVHLRGKDPHIRFSCNMCGYEYKSYPWNRTEEGMRKTKETMKNMAIQERERLFREELKEWFDKQKDTPSQADVDAAYRRLAAKWGV